ncbi:nucleotide sugar dehydrogenase [Candidatus Pelagibacter ubique]|nr:nucleotide sugar dehydrogenase [Candidatus Pelagibacter ubique]
MKKNKITIVGLGYTGLPLLIEFYKKNYLVNGFDRDIEKIKRLKKALDLTKEVKKGDLKYLSEINLVSNINDIKDNDIFILAVPTPINKNNKPDLRCLIDASKSVAKILKKKNIVVYESTVYPGCTEEICVPILEKYSGLKYNKDFFCGYSPERINPGDKKRGITNVVKVTSGSDISSSKKIDKLYKSIVTAGTHMAPNIKTAEAAKVIENIQRDLNIAFVNELAMLFGKLKINTADVLKAAETKWNFHSYKPGLVGGHCISVDPYYLTYKAKKVNYNPRIILSGRKINNSVSKYITESINKKLIKKKNNILVLGFAFKENCPDFRNTKVVDLVNYLKNNMIDIYDPVINLPEVKKYHNFKFLEEIDKFKKYDVIIIAVAHDNFKDYLKKNINKNLNKNGFIYDIKSVIKNNKRSISL